MLCVSAITCLSCKTSNYSGKTKIPCEILVTAINADCFGEQFRIIDSSATVPIVDDKHYFFQCELGRINGVNYVLTKSNNKSVGKIIILYNVDITSDKYILYFVQKPSNASLKVSIGVKNGAYFVDNCETGAF